MSRWTQVLATKDRGAYAIMFAVLLIVFVGTASVVVDLALLREARASTRAAADSAVVAAGSRINALDPAVTNPRAACQQAWAYLRQNLPGLTDGSGSCSGLPITGSACTSATAAQTVSAAAGGRTIRITWPVPNTSPLMTSPDTAPANVSQTIAPAVDGPDGCSRIAVQVLQANQLGFAGVFGASAVTTRSSSVARGIVEAGANENIAALNVLEQTRCGALTTDGQGSILVEGYSGAAGLIAVETSATTSCGGANNAGIAPSSSTNNFIRVNGLGGPGTGFLQAFALNPAPVGDPSKASVNQTNLFPPPSLLTARFGAKPVTDIFACSATPASPCREGGGTYIQDLRSRLGGPLHGGPTVPAGFTVLPSPAFPAFVCVQNGTSPPVVLPPGNYYLNCPGPQGFQVSTLVAFQGGTVVTAGKVDTSGGCLAVNVPVVVPALPALPVCPAVKQVTGESYATTNPEPTGDSVFYVRTGRLYKVAQASLYMPQTFTYLGAGYTDLGGGSGTLLWTTPLATSCSPTDLVCQNRAFSRLVLWSESTDLHSLGGQTALELRGTLFTPNAQSEFVGQGGSAQTDAQFWTKSLAVKGQGTLVMVSDPRSSISRPASGVALIR